jgi:hypothetical protein
MSGMFGIFAKKKSPEQVVAALKTDLEELVATSTHLDKVCLSAYFGQWPRQSADAHRCVFYFLH